MTSNARKVASTAMLLASISVVTPAMADGHGGGGWHGGGGDRHGDWHGGEGRHGGGHGGNVWGWGLLGLGLGLAIAAPYTPPRYYQPTYYQSTYYQPAYYPQPQVVVQSPSYIEQRVPEYMPPPPAPVYRQPAPVSEGSNWWYLCRQPEGYYPYIKTCPSGWQRVSPTPPG